MPLRPRLPELPLLRKELVQVLRTQRAFWFLVAAVTGSSLLSLLIWASSAVADTEQVVRATGTFLLAQLTAALFIVPAFAGSAISGERERGTYELLFATRLSPAAIIISKALAAAGYIAILLLASAPSVILLHLLGGVTFGTILKCQAVTLAAVTLTTLICLWQSLRAERTSKAVTLAMLGVIFWNGGLGFLVLLAVSLLRSAGSILLDGTALAIAAALSPHAAIALEIFGWPSLPGGQAVLPGHTWAFHVGSATILSLGYLSLLLLHAGAPGIVPARRDRRATVPDPGRWPCPPSSSGRAPRASAVVKRPLLTLLILELGGESGRLGNPVFHKEIRTEFYGRTWYRRLVFWGLCVLFALVVLVADGYDEIEKEVTTITSIGILLVALLAPAVAASAYPREIEHGNLDLLRGTLLSPWQVLRGKFFASLYATFGVLVAAGWGIGLAACFSPWHVSGGPTGRDALLTSCAIPLGVLATTWLFATALATCASVLVKRTLPALVGSYAALAAWFLLIPVIASGLGASLTDLSVATQPVSAVGQAFSGGPSVSLLAFFLFYAALTLALWHISRLEVEVLRGRDG